MLSFLRAARRTLVVPLSLGVPRLFSVTLSLALTLCLAVAACAQAAADPYADAARYEAGQPRTALLAVEAQIRAATPAELGAIEAELLKILQAESTTRDAQDWACRQLRQAGSERSVAALVGLLDDPRLETVARWALQSIPGEKVARALRDALPTLPPKSKAGVLQTIGSRRDRAAVAAVGPLASDPDAMIAEAALYALGCIGGSEALDAVRRADGPAELHRYREHTVLRCAEQMAVDGETAAAARVFRDVFAGSADPVIRGAALHDALHTEQASAADLALAALQDASPRLRRTAAKLVCEAHDVRLLKAVLDQLASCPADAVAAIFDLVTDPAAAPAASAAVRSDNDAIRLAAIGALGRIGDARTVAILLDIAAGDDGPAQAAARDSLGRLRGRDVDSALAAMIEQDLPRQRVAAIRALAARGATSATPVLLKTARDPDAAIRTEAIAALGALADRSALPELIQLLVADALPAQRAATEQAVLTVCQRIGDADATSADLLAAWPQADDAARGLLLRVLAKVPSDAALAALRRARQDPDATLRDAAIRGLAEWPDARPITDLSEIVSAEQSLTHRVLALRGLVRMAALPDAPPLFEKAGLLGAALARAPRIEDAKLVLGALGEVPDVAALELAAGRLGDSELQIEAATAVVKIAKRIQRTRPDEAKAAVQKILDVCTAPAARQLAENAWFVVDSQLNIAPQGTASSPDGWKADGAAGDAQAAIDNDPATYWDEEDGKSLYRLVVTLPQPEPIVALSVLGYRHHQFAPRDFEILCDGRVVKKIENAQYEDNLLLVKLDEISCAVVELKITGYYGGSPAIRELGLYRAQKK